jgi:outer membrane lipoprotein-sorting protein
MISACVFALAAACTAAPATDVDAFFKEFSAKRDGVVALDAAFTQKTMLPDEELTTKGSLTFIKPRRIIFHTDDPERTTLVDDRNGYEYDPEIKQLQIFDIEDNPQADIFFLGFNSNTEILRKAYDLTLFDITDDPRGKHGIRIKPKADSKEEAYFIEVNLYLRDEDYLPYRIHIRNDEESQVFIEVEAIDKAFRPTPQLTQIFLPQDTKVVENDRVVETVGPGGKRMPDAILMPPEPGTLKPAEAKPEPPAAAAPAPAPEPAPKAGAAPEAGKEKPAPDSAKKPGPKSVGGRKAKGAK